MNKLCYLAEIAWFVQCSAPGIEQHMLLRRSSPAGTDTDPTARVVIQVHDNCVCAPSVRGLLPALRSLRAIPVEPIVEHTQLQASLWPLGAQSVDTPMLYRTV